MNKQTARRLNRKVWVAHIKRQSSYHNGCRAWIAKINNRWVWGDARPLTLPQ